MAQPGKAGLSYYPLSTLPASLDIVWCLFPIDEAPNTPGPYPRPSLVRAVALNRDQTKAIVNITYGTSRIKENRTLDLQIQNCRSLDECGLEKATRFDLDKTIWLPWAKEFFRPPARYSGPILGHLDPQSCMQLEALKVARRALASRKRP